MLLTITEHIAGTNNDDHTDKVLKYFDSQVNTSKLIEQVCLCS
jgi:hypothetical protein